MKFAAKILCILFLLLMGYIAGRKHQAMNDEVLLQEQEQDTLKAGICMDSLNAYIDRLLDWKDVLYEGTKKEISDKINQEKQRRLNETNRLQTMQILPTADGNL
ncbi:MAG: hypothetical protein V1904_06240 [Bacteroidota bacterium]